MDNSGIYEYYRKSRLITACFFVLLIGSSLSAPAQTAYSRDFHFKEGIYPAFQQFRNNDPVLKSQIISEYDKNDVGFFEQLTAKNKNIKFRDTSGAEVEIQASGIWGYSKNNAVYINYEGNFSRMGVIGSLCHFVSNVTTYVAAPDPFYGMRYGGTSMPVTELRQFVLDAESGKTESFNVETMERILKRDEALYKEFMALKRRKKKESVFLYLRRYNERHPLYFPTADH
jgi:hypothetical protein